MRSATRGLCGRARPPCCTAPAGGSRPRATSRTTTPTWKKLKEIFNFCDVYILICQFHFIVLDEKQTYKTSV